MEDKIRVLVPEKDVDAKIAELGKKISEDYAGRQVHLVCVLKGGVFFMCELAKRITVPVTMDFMSVSSYGAGTESSGVVKIVKDLDQPLDGKDVLIVEDIVDSGWEEWGLPWEPLIPGKKAVVCVRILALMVGEWV